MVIIAILLGGVAFGILFTANQTSWDAQTILVWGFIGVVAIAGAILNLLKDAGIKVQM